MQNPIQNFTQSSIVFKKPGILSENLKALMSSNYPAVQYFFFKNFAHVSYLPLSVKVCVRFFLFCLDLELFVKIKKTWFLHTCFLLLITQDLNKIKKIPDSLL